jgi:hypothetical protein
MRRHCGTQCRERIVQIVDSRHLAAGKRLPAQQDQTAMIASDLIDDLADGRAIDDQLSAAPRSDLGRHDPVLRDGARRTVDGQPVTAGEHDLGLLRPVILDPDGAVLNGDAKRVGSDADVERRAKARDRERFRSHDERTSRPPECSRRALQHRS